MPGVQGPSRYRGTSIFKCDLDGAAPLAGWRRRRVDGYVSRRYPHLDQRQCHRTRSVEGEVESGDLAVRRRRPRTGFRVPDHANPAAALSVELRHLAQALTSIGSKLARTACEFHQADIDRDGRRDLRGSGGTGVWSRRRSERGTLRRPWRGGPALGEVGRRRGLARGFAGWNAPYARCCQR